jgi:hypothetical protein
MAIRKGRASLALAFLLSAVMLIGLRAPAAHAVSVDTVTGGQTSLFTTLDAVRNLGQYHIATSAIYPAYLTYTLDEGPAIRFPITDGAVESSTMLGTVNHAGGIRIQKYNSNFTTIEKSLEVTDVRIVAGASFVGNALGLVPSPAADLVNATWSKDNATGVIHYEADAQVGAVTALVLNTYFDTTAFHSGLLLGHVKSNIDTKKVLGL